ncbi:hypothetical protein [Alteromonas lipotrueiana]|uniref:hypothetical protein n=1 Tax=Alteromonas lipotrueiana TaxID=2803815 RepID=UPI001C462B3B|nr:hypothetical protein [Alteromonas lipotrueiana]
MSKDYRYQPEKWDSVEEGEFQGKKKSDRRHEVKSKLQRELMRREKQRRLHPESA